MVIVLGNAIVHEGLVDQALALSQAHVARSRTEPGCVAHAVHRDAENPARLVFVEQWASPQDLWQHFQVPASRAFAKALAALAVEPPSMALFEARPIPIPMPGGSGTR